MASGKKTIIAILLLAGLLDIFFIVNSPDFTPKLFLGVPYNPFVIYLYFIMIAAFGVFFYK